MRELKANLETKLSKRLPAHIFLDDMKLIDENSRETAAYHDPTYIPSYYWLGTLIQPTSVVELGFHLGLFTANFLRGCKTVERVLVFKAKTETYYPANFGRSNVRNHYNNHFFLYVGGIHDEALQQQLSVNSWDLTLINEEISYDEHRTYLDVAWNHASCDGVIAMEYVNHHKPATAAYLDFCKSNNREPNIVETRYGLGLIQK